MNRRTQSVNASESKKKKFEREIFWNKPRLDCIQICKLNPSSQEVSSFLPILCEC